MNDDELESRPEADRFPDDPSATEDQSLLASPAAGPFSAALAECAEILARLKERIDDHLGVPPDEVEWGHVADAQRLLDLQREADEANDAGGD